MKYLKAGFVFALFAAEGHTLKNGYGIWSILTDRVTPGRKAILEEKIRAVSLADKGLALLKSLNVPADDFRHRLWENAPVVTRAVLELTKCIISYFEDMESGKSDYPALKAQVNASMQEFERLAKLEERLKAHIVGQDEAVDAVARAIRRNRVGISPKKRPVSFIFVGPTGVGKTELVKQLATDLFDTPDALIRLDMSEFMEKHSVSRIVGSPPGYVGYDEAGQLTEKIRRKPYAVILFDEIEKAHPDVLNILLQILEDGRMTDSTGETVYFSETLIIFTSNLGMIDTDTQKGIRYQNVNIDMPYAEIEERILTSIKNYFSFTIGRPELMNRIGNNFVVFDFIREDVVDEILRGQIGKISRNLQDDKELTLSISPEFYQQLFAKASNNLINGGRGIGNIVESSLINPLSRIMVTKNPPRGSVIHLLSAKDDGSLNVDIS